MLDSRASGAGRRPPGPGKAGAIRNGAKVLGALLVLGAVVVIASLEDGRSDLAPPELLVEESPTAAYLACQEFPAHNLRTPSAAELPSLGEAMAIPRGGQWVVEAHVATEDGSGARLREELRCTPPDRSQRRR
jgi:hypothetical protein